MLITLTFTLAGITFVLVFRRMINSLALRHCLRRIPGPSSPSLLWGQEWSLYHAHPGLHYHNWHATYGKVVRFSGAFTHQVLSITDPRAVSFILGEGIYLFPKPRGVRAWFHATLGEGILWIEGKHEHEKQRRALAPALNPLCIRNFTGIFYESSSKLASQWFMLLEQSSVTELEIEMTQWVGRFALDTIGRAAFSYDINSLGGDSASLVQALDGLTNHENKLSSFYMRALFWLCPTILCIGKKGQMIRQAKRELGHIALQMWKDAKIIGSSDHGGLAKTLMGAMLRHDGKTSDEHIVSQMRTVISAGFEPVSALLAWILYELASHETVQRELREEISSVPDPSFEDLVSSSRFPLLDAFVRETIRLHPPILENHHEAGETISIPLSTPIPGTTDQVLVIPKGTTLSIPVNVIQCDPDVWGPDAHIFRPSRWTVPEQGEASSDDSYGRRVRDILAFSKGPRSCIGKSFALCEIKIFIITLLRHFSFACPYEIEPFQSFVVRPRVQGQSASSLPLIVKKLSDI